VKKRVYSTEFKVQAVRLD